MQQQSSSQKEQAGVHLNNGRYKTIVGVKVDSEGKYDEAIIEYKEALKHGDPEIKHKANINIGLSLNQLKKYSESIKYFQDAIELNDNNIKPFIGKAIALQKINKHEEAIAICVEILKKKQFENDADAYFIKGLSLCQLKRFSEGIEDFNRVITKQENYSGAYINKGIALVKLEKYAEAIEPLSNALKKINQLSNDEKYLCYYNRGCVLLEDNQFSKAIEDLQKAKEFTTSSSLIDFMLGEANLKLGRSSEGTKEEKQKYFLQAKHFYEAAIKSQGKHPLLFLQLSSALSELDQYDEAINVLANAVPDIVEVEEDIEPEDDEASEAPTQAPAEEQDKSCEVKKKRRRVYCKYSYVQYLHLTDLGRSNEAYCYLRIALHNPGQSRTENESTTIQPTQTDKPDNKPIKAN